MGISCCLHTISRVFVNTLTRKRNKTGPMLSPCRAPRIGSVCYTCRYMLPLLRRRLYCTPCPWAWFLATCSDCSGCFFWVLACSDFCAIPHGQSSLKEIKDVCLWTVLAVLFIAFRASDGIPLRPGAFPLLFLILLVACLISWKVIDGSETWFLRNKINRYVVNRLVIVSLPCSRWFCDELSLCRWEYRCFPMPSVYSFTCCVCWCIFHCTSMPCPNPSNISSNQCPLCWVLPSLCIWLRWGSVPFWLCDDHCLLCGWWPSNPHYLVEQCQAWYQVKHVQLCMFCAGGSIAGPHTMPWSACFGVHHHHTKAVHKVHSEHALAFGLAFCEAMGP